MADQPAVDDATDGQAFRRLVAAGVITHLPAGGLRVQLHTELPIPAPPARVVQDFDGPQIEVTLTSGMAASTSMCCPTPKPLLSELVQFTGEAKTRTQDLYCQMCGADLGKFRWPAPAGPTPPG